jgi:prephenate dehydrogenase
MKTLFLIALLLSISAAHADADAYSNPAYRIVQQMQSGNQYQQEQIQQHMQQNQQLMQSVQQQNQQLQQSFQQDVQQNQLINAVRQLNR